MKVVGIIAEYNPIHNGHLYHIQKAKQVTNSDYCIVVMSGGFTQAGNIAIYDKFSRAKIATKNGADLVIELPSIYATSSAEHFAFGGINILDKLNIVDNICFGSECNNINLLSAVSDIFIQKDKQIWKKINENLKNGISFASARSNALTKYLTEDQICILSKPNNILGLEYLKNLKLLNSKIEPFIVKRKSSNFNEILLNSNDDNFTSATSIRNCIKENKIEILKKYVPIETYNLITTKKASFNDDLFSILKYKIISSNVNDLEKINEVTEGLEYKIIKELNNSSNYEELSKNIKSKRYQLSKIKRMLINILLNITKDDFLYAKENKIAYAHILSCSDKGKDLLSKISQNSDIELITSINEKILDNISKDTRKYLNYDILASNIHSVVTNTNVQKDYTNRL